MFPGPPGDFLETHVVGLCHRPTESGMEQADGLFSQALQGILMLTQVRDPLLWALKDNNGMACRGPGASPHQTTGGPSLHLGVRVHLGGLPWAWAPDGKGSEGALLKQRLRLLAIIVTDCVGVQASGGGRGASPPQTSVLFNLFTGTFQNGFLLKF